MLQILQFFSEEDGATALEYGLLAALIGAVIVGAVTNLGQTILNAFVFIEGAISNALAP